jgi:hypothetical protein
MNNTFLFWSVTSTQTSLRFEVFTVVTMKNVVFWDMILCGSCKNRHFRGTYHLHLLGETYCLADYFRPKDGGNMFLWIISSYKSHMASHPRDDFLHIQTSFMSNTENTSDTIINVVPCKAKIWNKQGTEHERNEYVSISKIYIHTFLGLVMCFTESQ